MVMKQFVLLALLASVCLSTYSQSFVLQGRVTDDKDNPIEFASVTCARQGKVALTSAKGSFTLTLQSADSVVIRFSMLGYRAKTRVLRNPRGRQNLHVVMYADVNTLGEVEVKGEKIQTGQTQELKTKDMKMSPSVGGNAVEELIQSQAGVSTHSELSSQYNVRGGSFDENSVYINNVEVFRPFLVRSGQQEGLSVINPDMVAKIGFSTGGFEAKYGDKMSSALDITYKRPQRFEANASASLLGASAYVGLANKKIAWANGVRYKTNKYLLGSLQENGEYKPNFLDYQTYLSYTPDKRWQIDFIGNISESHYNFYPKDRNTAFGTMQNVMNFKVYFDGQEKDLFRTYFGSLAINRNLNSKTRLSLIASAFSTKERETYDIQGQYWLTQTETNENMAVGTYFESARNYLEARVQSLKLMLTSKIKKHDIEAALTLKREHIKENSIEYEMRDSAGYNVPNTGEDLYMIYSMRTRNQLDASRIESYIQDTWRFTSGTDSATTLYTLNYGLRMSHWNFNKETILSPRISLGIIPAWSPNTTLRIATGIYYQAPFFKELRDTTTVNHVTVARLNEKIKSQRSIHFVAGYDYRFRSMNRPFRFTAEAYYKILQNLIPYSINNVKVVYYGDNICSGYAAGLDMKLYGEFVPGTDSWISLSLMKTQMKLNGHSMPLPTDQRWAMNLFFTDYFPGTDRWKMTLRLAFADGLPFSAPHRETERNSFRAPAYKRADIGMSYRLFENEAKRKNMPFRNIWLGVDCLNLLGINNVNSYYWITDVTNQQYAVPNYLTGRMLNARVLFEF